MVSVGRRVRAGVPVQVSLSGAAAAATAVALTAAMAVGGPGAGTAAAADRGADAKAGTVGLPADAPAASGSWVETSTGSVSMMSLAQPTASVTWAGGADVTKVPQGDVDVTRFTPAMFRRDTARGGAWHRMPLPDAGAWDSRINDIATAADGSAFFVGDQPEAGAGSDGTGPQGVLVGRYEGGTWRLTDDTALPAGVAGASLLSVSAFSARDAWAVGEGYAQDTYAQVPVVQHWDGRHWRALTIPGSADWGLYQVHEVAPDDVWVVGADYDSGQSVAAHWDGHGWTRTPTPAFPDSAALFDVVARTPHDVWAVGWSRDTDKQRPAGLALHWDGTSWTQVALPAGTFGLQSVALRGRAGVAVVGGGDDAAVGLEWTPAAGWRSLGLPENDPELPLGASTVVSGPGGHLTVGGWHYHSSDAGDSFSSGVLLTR